jgi:hypothetical protein
MNKAFKIGTDKKNFVNLNFEFWLVLNHGDVTWDNSKEKSYGKQRKMIRDTIFGKSKKSYMYL